MAQDLPGDRRQVENELERLEIDAMKPEDAPVRSWLKLGRSALRDTVSPVHTDEAPFPTDEPPFLSKK